MHLMVDLLMHTACIQFIANTIKCTLNESYQDKHKSKEIKANDIRPAAICYPMDQSDSNKVHVD